MQRAPLAPAAHAADHSDLIATAILLIGAIVLAAAILALIVALARGSRPVAVPLLVIGIGATLGALAVGGWLHVTVAEPTRDPNTVGELRSWIKDDYSYDLTQAQATRLLDGEQVVTTDGSDEIVLGLTRDDDGHLRLTGGYVFPTKAAQ